MVFTGKTVDRRVGMPPWWMKNRAVRRTAGATQATAGGKPLGPRDFAGSHRPGHPVMRRQAGPGKAGSPGDKVTRASGSGRGEWIRTTGLYVPNVAL